MGTSRMMNRHGHDNAHVVKKIRTTVSTDKLESGVKLAQMLKGVSPCCFEYPVWLQARFAPVFVFGAAAVAWLLLLCASCSSSPFARRSMSSKGPHPRSGQESCKASPRVQETRAVLRFTPALDPSPEIFGTPSRGRRSMARLRLI